MGDRDPKPQAEFTHPSCEAPFPTLPSQIANLRNWGKKLTKTETRDETARHKWGHFHHYDWD